MNLILFSKINLVRFKNSCIFASDFKGKSRVLWHSVSNKNISNMDITNMIFNPWNSKYGSYQGYEELGICIQV